MTTLCRCKRLDLGAVMRSTITEDGTVHAYARCDLASKRWTPQAEPEPELWSMALERCAEIIRKARETSCPACELLMDESSANCTLCEGTRYVLRADRQLFSVEDVDVLVQTLKRLGA